METSGSEDGFESGIVSSADSINSTGSAFVSTWHAAKRARMPIRSRTRALRENCDEREGFFRKNWDDVAVRELRIAVDSSTHSARVCRSHLRAV